MICYGESHSSPRHDIRHREKLIMLEVTDQRDKRKPISKETQS